MIVALLSRYYRVIVALLSRYSRTINEWLLYDSRTAPEPTPSQTATKEPPKSNQSPTQAPPPSHFYSPAPPLSYYPRKPSKHHEEPLSHRFIAACLCMYQKSRNFAAVLCGVSKSERANADKKSEPRMLIVNY